jgi:pilus assembly protein CpaB
MINLTKIVAAILVLLAIALGGYAWMLSRKAPVPAPAATGAAVMALYSLFSRSRDRV